MDFLFWYALLTLIAVLVVGLALGYGARRVLPLKEVAEPTLDAPWPKVSVIVAARNEERHIQSSIESLLRLDYAPLEITVVDDRSEDRTGQILDELAATHPELNIVHLTELPAGWLGKNYALQFGAEHSTGDWLLFADADIHFEPTVLRRAIRYSLDQKLAHFCLMPELEMPSWLLDAFVIAFAMFLSIFARPWKARDMRSKAHIGVGAFNMVRADAYRAIGGHRQLAMRPDDDLKLGKVLKLAGFQPDVLSGVGLLSVPWYGSLREVFIGLEKNTFAAVEYRPVLTLLATFSQLACNVAPFVLPFVTTGTTRWLFVASAVFQILLAAGTCFALKARRTSFLGFPLAALLFVIIQWRSMMLALYYGGIRWRGTFYSLAELRANRV